MSGRLGRLAAILMLFRATAAHCATLDPWASGLLDGDPGSPRFVAIVVNSDIVYDEVKNLGLRKSTVFEFAGTIFTQVSGHDILSWADRREIRSIDVIDDTAAHTFFRLMSHLETLARYDDLGVLRPNVVNISMGPVSTLVGKSASGEHAVRVALDRIINAHHIPVVMSAGNDGPSPRTVNPWAIDTHVFVIGATDASGIALFERSSRFVAPAPEMPALFVAEGINTLGPRAGCRPKTEEEREEDITGNLTARVGRGNEDCWEIKSGTSFSAALVTKTLCLVHQSIHALRAMNDPSTADGVPVQLPVFVRSYIDFDFDRDMQVFQYRLVDSRVHFGPLSVAFPHALRQAFLDLILRSSLDLRLVYGPEAALAMLRAAAKPVPNRGSEDVGFGFISFENVADMLRSAHATDLVKMLGNNDARYVTWLEAAKLGGDPILLPSEVIDPIVQYCNSNDLILGLPVRDD